LLQILLGLSETAGGILLGFRRSRDPYGIPCLKEIQRSFSIDSIHHIAKRFYLLGVEPLRQQLVSDINCFFSSFRIGSDDVLRHHKIAGLSNCEIGLSRDNQSERL